MRRLLFLAAVLSLCACTPAGRDEGPCEASCGNRACGDDGCGGSCGSCPDDKPYCSAAGSCTSCQPSCADKQCGDDGCGGTCGGCPPGNGCSAVGRCFQTGGSCQSGCPAGTYCNGTQGCVAGCIRDDQCRTTQTCDLATHSCKDRPELCNGLDEDGDGQIDEDFPLKGKACDGADADKCANGVWTCSTDGKSLVCEGDTNHAELCNGKDDDCDGQVDEDFAQVGQPCDGPDADRCANGVWTCSADGKSAQCTGDQAHAEVCNGVDDDCDGQVDTSLSVSPLLLPGMSAVAASEFRADGSYTLLVRTASGSTSGAQVWEGSRTGSPRAGPTATGYVSAAAIENGKAVALLPNGVVWWGSATGMQQASLPAFPLTISREMGGSVGFASGVPFVSRVAEGTASGDTTRQTQRVMYQLQGSTWTATSLYKHAYQGGNLDNGSFVALPNGTVLGLVRDEWSNMYYSGMDIRCDWISRTNGAWRLGANHSMCDPVASLVQANGRAYAITEKWGGPPDTLRSTADGVTVSTLSWPLTATDDRPSLAADDKGRVHLVSQEKNSTSATPLRDRLVVGGSTQMKALRTPGGTSTYYAWGAVGDELDFVLYDVTSWGAPATNVRLVRELVCH